MLLLIILVFVPIFILRPISFLYLLLLSELLEDFLVIVQKSSACRESTAYSAAE